MPNLVTIVGTGSLLVAVLAFTGIITTKLTRSLRADLSSGPMRGRWLLVVSLPFLGIGSAMYLAAASFQMAQDVAHAAKTVQLISTILTSIGMLVVFVGILLIIVETTQRARRH